MADDDDFKFCRLVDDDIAAEKLANDIRGIHVEDGNTKSSSEIHIGKKFADSSEIHIGKKSADSSEIHIDDGNENSADKRKNREGKVGSLSFTVVDALTRKEIYHRHEQAGHVVAGSSSNASPEQKTPVRKSVARAKVPFEKGYSQMDWLKLTRTQPDLAGLKGQSNRRLISLSEVKQHHSEGSMWTVLNGRVYNIAPYMKFHPGGADMLMKGVGKDCTSLFNKYHAWVNAEFLLEKCLVGILHESQE